MTKYDKEMRREIMLTNIVDFVFNVKNIIIALLLVIIAILVMVVKDLSKEPEYRDRILWQSDTYYSDGKPYYISVVDTSPVEAWGISWYDVKLNTEYIDENGEKHDFRTTLFAKNYEEDQKYEVELGEEDFSIHIYTDDGWVDLTYTFNIEQIVAYINKRT